MHYDLSERHKAMMMAMFLQGHGYEQDSGEWNTRYATARVLDSQHDDSLDLLHDVTVLLDAGVMVRTNSGRGFILSDKVVALVEKHMQPAWEAFRSELQTLE